MVALMTFDTASGDGRGRRGVSVAGFGKPQFYPRQ